MSCKEEADEPFFPSIWVLNINWLMLKTRYFTHTKSDYYEFRRHDSALQDGSDKNVNLTGGYYDAG
jgi:hypothetical protein